MTNLKPFRTNLITPSSAKATALCKDIEILSQTFERIVDRKDAIIKSLAQDLSEAEEQYQLALR